jgi:hypothetical protein
VSEWRAQSPLGITAIGLYMLFGACLMPINIYRGIYLGAPAFLAGVDFRGGAAMAFFLAMGMADAIIGIGLLRLAPWSRMVAIYFFMFRAANMVITFLLPGSRARFEDGIAATQAALGQSSVRRSPIWFGPVLELAVMALALWVLFAQKKAFPAPGLGLRGSLR